MNLVKRGKLQLILQFDAPNPYSSMLSLIPHNLLGIEKQRVNHHLKDGTES